MIYTRVQTNADGWVPTPSSQQCPGIEYLSGEIDFTDGAIFNTASRDLCYLGSQTATPVDVVEEFDCESYVETAPTLDGHPYLVINSRETKTWNLGTSITAGFSCPVHLVSWCLLAAYVEYVWNVLDLSFIPGRDLHCQGSPVYRVAQALLVPVFVSCSNIGTDRSTVIGAGVAWEGTGEQPRCDQDSVVCQCHHRRPRWPLSSGGMWCLQYVVSTSCRSYCGFAVS